MAVAPFVYVEALPAKRYVVETANRHKVDGTEVLVVIYEGNNRERAIESANFWDERQNTYFTDRYEAIALLPQDALSVANRKFDALEKHILAS